MSPSPIDPMASNGGTFGPRPWEVRPLSHFVDRRDDVKEFTSDHGGEWIHESFSETAESAMKRNRLQTAGIILAVIGLVFLAAA